MWGAGNQLRKEGGVQAGHTHTCSDLGNGVGITQAQSGKQTHGEDYTWELACTPLGSVCKIKIQRRTLDREQGHVTSQPAQSRGESEDCRRSGSQVGLAAGAGASAHVHRSLGRATVCSQPLRVRSQPSIRRKAWVTVGQQSQQSGEELAVDGEEDTEERVWTNELAGPFASVSPTSSHDGPQGADFSLGLL